MNGKVLQQTLYCYYFDEKRGREIEPSKQKSFDLGKSWSENTQG